MFLRTLRSVAPVVLSGVLLVACGGGSGGSDQMAATSTTTADATTSTTTVDATSTTTTAPPVPGAESEEAAILEAVDGYWRTLLESSQPPDPDHPGLERYLTGEALARSREVISGREELGQALRIPEDASYRHESTVVSYTSERAVVEDCGIDDLVLYDRRSGEALNNEVVTNRWTLVLEPTSNGWKVKTSEIEEKWEGVAGCAGD